jgi:hypothetical protein
MKEFQCWNNDCLKCVLSEDEVTVCSACGGTDVHEIVVPNCDKCGAAGSIAGEDGHSIRTVCFGPSGSLCED